MWEEQSSGKILSKFMGSIRWWRWIWFVVLSLLLVLVSVVLALVVPVELFVMAALAALVLAAEVLKVVC